MFDLDTASQSLGIELIEAEGGRAIARMSITGSMVNGHNIAHGGYVFILADTAFACACNSHGPVTVAAAAEVSFVSAAFLDDALIATAEERTRYGRNGIYDVTVHRELTPGRPDSTDVVAEFRGHSRTVNPTTDNPAQHTRGDRSS